MKLNEVIKGLTSKRKLMEGQADKYVHDGLKSLLNIFQKYLPESDYIHKEIEGFKNIFINEYSEITNLPNSWKMFFARSFIALVIDNFLEESLSDDEYLNMPPKVMNRLEQKRKPAKGIGIDSLELANMLTHWYGLSYPPIQNLNLLERLLETNNIDHVIDELSQLEDEYTEKQEKYERYIPIMGNENWILEVDEYKWLAFDDYCSERDGKAMRHCGNTPGDEDDKVFTLNSVEEIDGEWYRTPHVFVVLHKGGYVGEMKGFGNSKPKEEYHRAIVEFLKQDFVEYIVKGRWAPENDFSIRDLSTELANELYAAKGINFIQQAMDVYREIYQN